MSEGRVREITRRKGMVCREILADLPAWFAIPEAVDAYVRAVETLPMFGFVMQAQTLGFIAVKPHNAFVAEAFVLGVKRSHHRTGIGRSLFGFVEQRLRERGCVYLTVKTVAPGRPNDAYAATRRFYDALGFVPVEIFPTLWGPENPCLLMIKSLD